MLDREKVIGLLQEMSEYFRECRSNASFASKAENHFWELQNAANEAVELLKEYENLEKRHEILVNHADTMLAMLKERNEKIAVLNRFIEQMPKPTKLLDVYGDGYAKVIRCKDCKYCGSETRDGIRFAKCELKHNWMPQGDWFCADGERK